MKRKTQHYRKNKKKVEDAHREVREEREADTAALAAVMAGGKWKGYVERTGIYLPPAGKG